MLASTTKSHLWVSLIILHHSIHISENKVSMALNSTLHLEFSFHNPCLTGRTNICSFLFFSAYVFKFLLFLILGHTQQCSGKLFLSLPLGIILSWACGINVVPMDSNQGSSCYSLSKTSASPPVLFGLSHTHSLSIQCRLQWFSGISSDWDFCGVLLPHFHSYTPHLPITKEAPVVNTCSWNLLMPGQQFYPVPFRRVSIQSRSFNELTTQIWPFSECDWKNLWWTHSTSHL